MNASFIPRMRRVTRGFTLIELLTVIAIIGILAAILIPTVGKARSQARNAQCLANLRQISLASLLYVEANRDNFPFGYTTGGGQWHLQIEPYFGNARSGWNTISNPVLTCPRAELPPGPNRSSYAANPRVFVEGQVTNPSNPPRPLRRSAILRPSETILATDSGRQDGFEANWGLIHQGDIYTNTVSRADDPMPDNSSDTRNGVIRWRHDGRTNAAFSDGHAKSMRVGELKFRHFQINY